MGDDRSCEIHGEGNVVLNLDKGTIVVLENVRYIPKLSRNLISLGTFEKFVYGVSLKNGKAKVISGCMMVLPGTRGENNFYLLDGQSSRQVNESIWWHKRLGHICHQGLVGLQKQLLIDWLIDVDPGFCEHCIIGKAHRVKFARSEHATKAILDYIHLNMWGFANSQFLGGARYFISLLLDYSRRV